tara:strand:- start:2571 stop:2864 length:294 start_codon:yes stop_codon:yes gene_type:complete
MVKAASRVRAINTGSPLQQYYAMLALLMFIGLSSILAVWMVREAEHKGMIALAAYDWCAEPRPLSHVSACTSFACLAKINDDNARYVRICHPEALRS